MEDHKEEAVIGGNKALTPRRKRRIKREHIEVAFDDNDSAATSEAAVVKSESPKKRKRRISVSKAETEESDKSVANEKHTGTRFERWLAEYRAIEKMREKRDAPVDTVGCEAASQTHLGEKAFRYHVLVSLMLSSQTKDAITAAAMEKLKQHGLTVENIRRTSEDTIKDLIYPVGFYSRKAGYIKRTADILAKEYDGDIPETVADLCSLPGVGPKMAHICMSVAWNRCVGIGVDVHVHRISNRLHWVHNTKTPEHTRKELETFVPEEYWPVINKLLVGFGQQICTPIGPKCSQCLLNKTCPTGIERLSTPTKSKSKTANRKPTNTKRKAKIEPEEDSDDDSAMEQSTSAAPNRRATRSSTLAARANRQSVKNDNDEEENSDSADDGNDSEYRNSD